MRTKVAPLCLLLALLAAGCGGGNGSNGTAPDEPGATSSAADQASSDATPDVERASKDEVNRPREGAYVYDYEAERTNYGTSDAKPIKSKPGTTLTSTLSNRGDSTTTKDKSTQGDAVATTQQRWEAGRVVDISTKFETNNSSTSCTYSTPIEEIHIPIKKEKFPAQKLDGAGELCAGVRTITVEGQESVKDARGASWKTWRIRLVTVTKQPGLTTTNNETRWFSPDLGKDVRIEGKIEFVDAEGKVAVRALQKSILRTYPSA